MSEKISGKTMGAIAFFASKKKKYDTVTKQYNEYKEAFEQAMDECFTKELSVARKNIAVVIGGEKVTITRMAKTTIEWFADKLKKHVTKEVYNQCVKKRYEVIDMKGLTRYLRTCGVDPKIFKQYIAVEEVIDQDAIDRVSELGLIGANDIRGCYVVHCSKPYYQVRIKEGES